MAELWLSLKDTQKSPGKRPRHLHACNWHREQSWLPPHVKRAKHPLCRQYPIFIPKFIFPFEINSNLFFCTSLLFWKVSSFSHSFPEHPPEEPRAALPEAAAQIRSRETQAFLCKTQSQGTKHLLQPSLHPPACSAAVGPDFVLQNSQRFLLPT